MFKVLSSFPFSIFLVVISVLQQHILNDCLRSILVCTSCKSKYFFSYGAYLYKAHVMLDPGAVFIVANAILFGSYYLGVLSPHLMAMMSARVAAAVIYRTIDRVCDTI